MAVAYGPIMLHNSASQELIQQNWPEGATQTFKLGVPLRLSSGMAVACDTANPWSAADIIIGVSAAAGSNLTTANTAEDGASYATPINQANAKTIAVGTPVKSATVPFYRADGLNVFRMSLQSGQTYSQALVIPGTFYALVFDATTGYWFVNSTDTSGNNNVIEIVGPDPNDNTNVLVKFRSGQRYF